MTDSEFQIPEPWPDARVFLMRELEERRLRLEQRDDSIEGKVDSLAAQIAETQMELHGVRDGVSHLNESFRHVSEQNALLINMISTDTIDQRDRWDKYEAEQREQGRLLRDGYAIVHREDKFRNAWRIGLLGAVLIGLFLLGAAKVSG